MFVPKATCHIIENRISKHDYLSFDNEFCPLQKSVLLKENVAALINSSCDFMFYNKVKKKYTVHEWRGKKNDYYFYNKSIDITPLIGHLSKLFDYRQYFFPQTTATTNICALLDHLKSLFQQ
ncbi:conserved hypothetical protein [Trichinella spiralis]|uniref:hypothetical protein n=1 Tax=Trichinella spiralis TaxID=6334 RepID=UPI0001EFD1AB|nr:conserved hypothetical protein [Trichinella spiralis]